MQMKRYHKIFFIALTITFSLLAAFPLSAAESPEDRRRELLERIESLRPTEEIQGVYDRWYWYDYGGWLTGTYSDPHNDANPDTAPYSFREDVRLWTKAGVKVPQEDWKKWLGKEHTAYFRLKNAYQHEHLGDNDNEGPLVDMLYWTGHWSGKAGRLKTNLGRHFFALGRGLVYSDINDGVDIEALLLNLFSYKIFYSRTLPNQDNLDTSVPNFGKHYERHFFGMELEFLKLAQHRPYVFFMRTEDSSEEDPDTLTADFTYDAYYYGAGSKGELFFPNLRYFGELILERGKNHLSGVVDTANIKASAYDTGLEYYFKFYSRPVVKLEYAHGSGDEERQSVTNTTAGNPFGLDKNFLYFGHFTSGGFALNARLSNIDIYKLGLTAKPFEKGLGRLKNKQIFQGLPDLTLGSNYYVFRKAESAGGISDARASRNFSDIGTEWDLFVTWRVSSDLSWSFKWGYLDTEDAYLDDGKGKNERFMTSGLTLSF